ncbi:unnamed protein product [Boreogadus saida]
MGLLMVLAAGALGAVMVLAAGALGAGFTAAGITVGSWAAGMMSGAAAANGGAVAAGTIVAVLQSTPAFMDSSFLLINQAHLWIIIINTPAYLLRLLNHSSPDRQTVQLYLLTTAALSSHTAFLVSTPTRLALLPH